MNVSGWYRWSSLSSWSWFASETLQKSGRCTFLYWLHGNIQDLWSSFFFLTPCITKHFSKGDFKKHYFIHTYPCSLFTVGTRESWESKRSLKKKKQITSTRFHTKDESFNKYIFSKYMRVSFPDLWSLSSMISRKSWNTQFTLQSHDDIKQGQIEKKSLSFTRVQTQEPQLYYLDSALSLYSWNEIYLIRFYLLSYCSKWSSLTRGANTTFRPLWTVLSSGPWYSNFTLLQKKWIKTNVT